MTVRQCPSGGAQRVATRPALFSLCFWLLACAATPHSTAQAPGSARVPAGWYATAATPHGVVGGAAAESVARALSEKLAARGDQAEADGKLAATAGWLLEQAEAGVPRIEASATTKVAQGYGFAGVLMGARTLEASAPNRDALLDRLVAEAPSNRKVTRYGVAGQGDDVAIVIASVEAALEPIPRSSEPGVTLRLRGRIDAAYARASVFVTSPDGAVREQALSARKVEADIPLSTKGLYGFEIMGYGNDGPTVLVNVPVRVGLAESDAEPVVFAVDPALTPERAESRLFELLNDARKKAGLATLVSDPELRALSLAHSSDMAEHRFVGHVSPTKGGPEDRGNRAGLRASRLGECVASDSTPEGAHQGLMDSPAHRAGMLDPLFSHAGVGVVFRDEADGRRVLLVTLTLARFPPPEEAHQTPRQLFDALLAYRKARGVPALGLDAVLAESASAGIRTLGTGGPGSEQRVLDAAGRALELQVSRHGGARAVCLSYVEILERRQLSELPLVMDRRVARVGIGSATLENARGPRLAVLLILEGPPGRPLECR